MGLALYFTYTRSALVAVVFGLVALVLFLKTRIKGEIILFALLMAIYIIAANGILEGSFLGGRDAGHAAGKHSVTKDIVAGGYRHCHG